MAVLTENQRRHGRRTPYQLNCLVSVIHLLLTRGSYTLNALAIATAVTALITFLVGVVVLVRGRATLASPLFCAISSAAAGWLCSFALLYASRGEEVAIVWARAGHLMASLIPAAAFHFAAIYPNNRRHLRGWIALCWFFCTTVGLLGAATPLLIPVVRHYSWGWFAR